MVNSWSSTFLISEWESLRSPKTMAPVPLQASTQAGSSPSASRSPQKLHFSTTPRILVGKSALYSFINGRGSCQLKLRDPEGQGTMPFSPEENLEPEEPVGDAETMEASE